MQVNNSRITILTYPDGDRERERDLDGLLDPELRERLPASLAPAKFYYTFFTSKTDTTMLLSLLLLIITFRIRHFEIVCS